MIGSGPTAEQRKRWRELVEYHRRECSAMQACCGMAASEGADAIEAMLLALANEERQTRA